MHRTNNLIPNVSELKVRNTVHFKSNEDVHGYCNRNLYLYEGQYIHNNGVINLPCMRTATDDRFQVHEIHHAFDFGEEIKKTVTHYKQKACPIGHNTNNLTTRSVNKTVT